MLEILHSPLLPTSPLLPSLLYGKLAPLLDNYALAKKVDATILKQAKLMPHAISNGKKEQNEKEGGIAGEDDSSTSSEYRSLLASKPISSQLIHDLRASMLHEYALNSEQISVLDQVIGWFYQEHDQDAEMLNHAPHHATSQSTEGSDHAQMPNNEEEVDLTVSTPEGQQSASAPTSPPTAPTSPPVLLVHGTFGSGKSYLLVRIVIFLSRLLDIVDKDKQIKIMIAALTNVAGQARHQVYV